MVEVTPTRITGKLESFNTLQGLAHGYVRLPSGELLHVPARDRGVLEPEGSIRRCANGERYHPIREGTLVALDVVFNRNGEKPYPVSWAPDHKSSR